MIYSSQFSQCLGRPETGDLRPQFQNAAAAGQAAGRAFAEKQRGSALTAL
jgi:hypothetical protein